MDSEGWIYFWGRERKKSQPVRGSILDAWQWKEIRKQVVEIKGTIETNKQHKIRSILTPPLSQTKPGIF